MIRYGFNQSQGDHTLSTKRSPEGKLTALIVYVDDIILIGDDLKEMGQLKNYLSKEFEIKDLVDSRFFLGIEVGRATNGIFLS